LIFRYSTKYCLNITEKIEFISIIICSRKITNKLGVTAVKSEFNRTRKRLLKRNKYVIVIGSVLAIYTVYLISYSAIKFLFVSRLKSSRLGISFTAMYYVRWGFQTLMCINTLLQPLCYFRMQEFRSTFKTVIFRRKQSKSLIAETTYLSTTESRRRIVLGNNNRNDKNEREQIT
uniref:G_PROTEIN_RECEP_F1_2 domain-containing protein n=1 Tax=Brugia timori TaxID=42155 RepID=A0A0R3R4H9_9BILA